MDENFCRERAIGIVTSTVDLDESICLLAAVEFHRADVGRHASSRDTGGTSHATKIPCAEHIKSIEWLRKWLAFYPRLGLQLDGYGWLHAAVREPRRDGVTRGEAVDKDKTPFYPIGYLSKN